VLPGPLTALEEITPTWAVPRPPPAGGRDRSPTR
jgi:hypothetical protein